jgi:hypothetical protein
MAARRHALRQRQRLPFRSADTQRGEYVRDTHFTHTLQKIKWDDDNARGQALAASRFGPVVAYVPLCSPETGSGKTSPYLRLLIW